MRIMSTTNDEWTIESWCTNQVPSDWTTLSQSVQEFLYKLNLSSIHPFCDDTSPLYERPYDIPGVPRQGPLLNYDHFDSIFEKIVTFVHMAIPALAAMTELWLRLFASIIAPIGITYLFYYNELQNPFDSTTKKNSTTRQQQFFLAIVCTLSSASSAAILTDTLYILEFGPQLGGILLVVSVLLSIRICVRYALHKALYVQFALIALVLYLSYDGSTQQLAFGCPEEKATIGEGLYYDHSNTLIKTAVEKYWDRQYWTYTYDTGATRWMVTGDTRTGLPFLLNKVSEPVYIRVWVPMPHDNEVVAVDISFPTIGHNTSKPFYLLFHGLNGGSAEEYVRDFVQRRNDEGSTVAVMVARGLMDLPIRGFNCFHGARWEDGHVTSQVLKAALDDHQILAGVGYSMGAIILGNLVARAGSECAFDVAVAISGGLDMRQQIDFYRAQRLWQPMLTNKLRDTFVLGKWGERVRYRLTKHQMKQLMQATHITEIDETAVVAYNGFRDIIHYYSEMSVLGDIPYHPNEYQRESIPSTKRVHNISIPFCVIHALDDPLISWRTVAANDGIMNPTKLTKTGSGHLVLLLTKRGGHVGWPLGLIPQTSKWRWMNDAAMSFAQAIATSKRNN